MLKAKLGQGETEVCSALRADLSLAGSLFERLCDTLDGLLCPGLHVKPVGNAGGIRWRLQEASGRHHHCVMLHRSGSTSCGETQARRKDGEKQRWCSVPRSQLRGPEGSRDRLNTG